MLKLTDFVKNNFLLFAAIIAAVLLFGINLFHFPYFEGDEGIYVSRAWAFLNEGRLSTKTYWYDHAPLGWIGMSFWMLVTLQDRLFHYLLYSGRAFIFFLQVLNTVLMFYIAYHLTKDKILAFFSALLFAVSPLQIYFGRRILLDNIMVFWVLLSLFSFLHVKNINLKIFLSALFLAIGVLTKETAILFVIPFFFIQFWTYTEDEVLSLIKWLAVFLGVLMLYPAFAYYRGELMPSNFFETGQNPSLITTLFYQVERDNISIFNFKESPFWTNAYRWFIEDPVLIIVGPLSVIINLFLVKKDKIAFVLALFVIVQFLFLIRGGTVFEFYILPLIPFLILNITYLIYKLTENRNLRIAYIISLILVITSFIMTLNIKGVSPFRTNQTGAQIAAVDWIDSNSIDGNVVIVDNYAIGEFYKTKRFEVKSHFDSQYDYEFKEDIKNGRKKVSYLITTEQIEKDIKNSNLDFVRDILKNSDMLEEFQARGWNVKLYKPKT